MNTKRWVAVGIAAVLFVSSILMSVVSSFFKTADTGFFSSFGESFLATETILQEGDLFRRIAVLRVDGVIAQSEEDAFLSTGYSHSLMMENLELLRNDSTVEALILVVNSPGGGVYESAQIRDKLVQIRQERDLPVYVVMGSLAASGGYYISAEADRIFASAETLTGSIGVIMSGLNYAGLLERVGIEDNTVKSGEHKDIGSSTRPWTEEEVRILQELIDGSYQRFVDIVANGRGIDRSVTLEIADGRIFDGIQAKALGLVDDIGYFEDALGAMMTEYELDDAQVFEYPQQSFGFLDMMDYRLSKLFKSGGLSGLEQSVAGTSKNHPRMMYLFGE
jgi:protease IV